MQLKIQNRCAENTLLPFNLVKGSVKERNAKSWQYWNKFLDKFMQAEECTVDTFRNAIDSTIEPNKINYKILKEKNLYFSGSTGIDIKLLPHENGGLYVQRVGYKIKLPISKNSKTILNKLTAVHEARHLFDYLLQPKTACLRAKELVNNEKYDNDVDKLRTITLIDVKKKFSRKDFEQNFEKTLDKLPDNIAIEALQKLRTSLMTEINASKCELKYLIKNNPLKNFGKIIRIFLFYNNCNFKTKEKFVSIKLKELLEKARNDLRAKNA